MKRETRQRVLRVSAIALWLSVAFVGESFAAERVPDNLITLNVEEALGSDARVDSSEVTVSVKKGIATLSGSVTSIGAKRYADLEATKINGVLSVVNQIRVSPTWRSDADLRNAVRRRILNSAVIESERIEVASSEGKVTLSGTVSAWNEREEAALLASEVRGVAEVVDNISTRWAKTRSDQEIKKDAVAKLARDVYLGSLPITVAVRDGIVTLRGTVGSAFEKNRAHDAVRSISHVKDLKNKLKVEYWQDYATRKKRPIPSDSDLKQSIRNELEVDSRVDASKIRLKVFDGLVTLSGTVESHARKKIAEQDAKDVIGVARVSNKLFARVDRRANWVVRDDVEFNLDTDATTEGFDLGVKVKDGIVTLSGSVNSWYERSHAGDVASRVTGVKDVMNQIGVDSHNPATAMREHYSAQVANAIREGLEANWSTKWVAGDIRVSVDNGVATLAGEVGSWYQRSEAADVAYTTKGVWEVKNELAVEDYDYEWGDFTYYDGPYAYRYGYRWWN